MLLREIILLANISPDNSEDIICELLKPQNYTRNQMRNIMESTIGYDPIDFYYEQDIRSIISNIDKNNIISDDAIAEIVKEALPLINASADKEIYKIECDLVESIIKRRIPDYADFDFDDYESVIVEEEYDDDEEDDDFGIRYDDDEED